MNGFLMAQGHGAKTEPTLRHDMAGAYGKKCHGARPVKAPWGGLSHGANGWRVEAAA